MSKWPSATRCGRIWGSLQTQKRGRNVHALNGTDGFDDSFIRERTRRLIFSILHDELVMIAPLGNTHEIVQRPNSAFVQNIADRREAVFTYAVFFSEAHLQWSLIEQNEYPVSESSSPLHCQEKTHNI